MQVTKIIGGSNESSIIPLHREDICPTSKKMPLDQYKRTLFETRWARHELIQKRWKKRKSHCCFCLVLAWNWHFFMHAWSSFLSRLTISTIALVSYVVSWEPIYFVSWQSQCAYALHWCDGDCCMRNVSSDWQTTTMWINKVFTGRSSHFWLWTTSARFLSEMEGR